MRWLFRRLRLLIRVMARIVSALLIELKVTHTPDTLASVIAAGLVLL